MYVKSALAGFGAIGFLLVCASSANAAFITSEASIASPVLIDLSSAVASGPFLGATPMTIATGVHVSSTNPDNSYLGLGLPYYFGDNGVWDASMALVGTDLDLVGGDQYQIDFTFDTPVAAVGGLVNYIVFAGSGFSNPRITAKGLNGNVLESYDLVALAPISTPGGLNEGRFRGISRPSADIYSFAIANSGIALTGLTVGTESVPEPTSLSLTVLAMITAVIFFARNRRATS